MESVNRSQTLTESSQNVSGYEVGRYRDEEKSAPFTPDMIERYLEYFREKGRVKGTMEWYRRGLNRFYRELPEGDKSIRRDTLKNWREKLVRDGYAPSTINQFIVVVNGFLEYIGLREFQIVEKLDLTEELQPELSRAEYLQLLRTARALGRERVYLLVKVFANTGLPVQELPKLTVEAAHHGKVNITYNGMKQVVHFPMCICEELLAYTKRKGIQTGPIFLTRDGVPISRTNVTTGIRHLCVAAHIPEEKGSPRCLKRLYQSTKENIQRSIAVLVEQSQNRLLEEEQMQIAWENSGQ